MTLLDDKAFSAVPEVLKEIENSIYSYSKPQLADLRARATEQLTALAPANYIIGLKAFIDSLK